LQLPLLATTEACCWYVPTGFKSELFDVGVNGVFHLVGGNSFEETEEVQIFVSGQLFTEDVLLGAQTDEII